MDDRAEVAAHPEHEYHLGAPVSWTSRDVRFTRRENTVYASSFTSPDSTGTTVRPFAGALPGFAE